MSLRRIKGKNQDTGCPPPLPRYLGIILTYRCQHPCGHCLYNSGPDRSEVHNFHAVEETLSELDELGLKEVALHIGGGEPFTVFPLLLDVVSTIRRRDLYLDFIETSGSWYRSKEYAAARLLALRSAGMERILISASPFHQSYIAPAKIRKLISLSRSLLGPEGVIVNSIELLEEVEKVGGGSLLPFDEYVRAVGAEHALAMLRNRSLPLNLAGRAAETLKKHLARHEANTLTNDCASKLLRSDTWHYDPVGRIHIGYCSGISYPVPHGLARWYGSCNDERWQVCRILVHKGLQGLLEFASREAGFDPDPEGYISACHACQDARLALWRLGRYQELGPDGFYIELARLKSTAVVRAQG